MKLNGLSLIRPIASLRNDDVAIRSSLQRPCNIFWPTGASQYDGENVSTWKLTSGGQGGRGGGVLSEDTAKSIQIIKSI